MTQRNHRLNASMRSLDGLSPEKDRRFGDFGCGAERIRSFEETGMTACRHRLDEATDAAMLLLGCIRLLCDGRGHLIGSLRTIYANRNDVMASIVEICRSTRCGRSAARRKYYLHRRELTVYFGEGVSPAPGSHASQ